MIIQESQEMYLETIYVLSQQLQNVRSIDVCHKMNYSKPSVSRAMKKLSSEKYIEIDENGYITLLDKGLKVAQTIYERHQFLTEYFIKLGVDKKVAEDDACRIEHVISKETFEALKKAIN